MTDAFIYDHVRSPRGRGRPDGSLHEIPAVELATQVLQALRARSDLDTSRLDDIVFGCVAPKFSGGLKAYCRQSDPAGFVP